MLTNKLCCVQFAFVWIPLDVDENKVTKIIGQLNGSIGVFDNARPLRVEYLVSYTKNHNFLLIVLISNHQWNMIFYHIKFVVFGQHVCF